MSITWMTPFVARMSAVTTVELPSRISFPPASESAICSPSRDVTLPLLLRDGDRLGALDRTGDSVVGEYLRQQRGVGEHGLIGGGSRSCELLEGLVGRREDGERPGAGKRLDEPRLLHE